MADSTTITDRRAFLGLAVAAAGTPLAAGELATPPGQAPEPVAATADRYLETRHIRAE